MRHLQLIALAACLLLVIVAGRLMAKGYAQRTDGFTKACRLMEER